MKKLFIVLVSTFIFGGVLAQDFSNPTYPRYWEDTGSNTISPISPYSIGTLSMTNLTVTDTATINTLVIDGSAVGNVQLNDNWLSNDGGDEGIRVSDAGEVSINKAPITGTVLNLPSENDATTPTLSFGDGDTGLYESADDSLMVSIGGNGRWAFKDGYLGVEASGYPQLRYSNSTNTVPNIIPDSVDLDTGLGSNEADQLSLIAGAKEMLRLVEDTVSYVQIAANDMWLTWTDNAGTGTINAMKVNASDEIEFGTAINIGTLDLSDDSGLVGLVDMGVTATPSAGVVEGYSFAVDATDILTVYAEADGSGGIQNERVGIGTASPASTLSIDEGTGWGQVTMDGSSGGCLMIRDTDDDGWTECSVLNGTMTCTTDADGVCDGS